MASNDFDFGFTFEDSDTSFAPPAKSIDDAEFRDELLSKISVLESKLNNADIQTVIDEHKDLLKIEARSKLHEVENLILPLLYNLQKNPDKEYIHWPNRKDIIQKQIDKILEVTNYYG
jgi:hypothetical protein